MFLFCIKMFFDFVMFMVSYVVCDFCFLVCVIIDLVFDFDMVFGCILIGLVVVLVQYICDEGFQV